MLHFDDHLVHLRSSIFWMKFGQLLVYDTDDSLQAAVTRLGSSNCPVPPLLSLQGGCHRCATCQPLFTHYVHILQCIAPAPLNQAEGGDDLFMYRPHRQHLNVTTRFYCPQAFLSLDFQCQDDLLELK